MVLLRAGVPYGSPGDHGVLSWQGIQGNICPDPLGGESGTTEQGSAPRIPESTVSSRHYNSSHPPPFVTVFCLPGGSEEAP